MTEQRTIQQPGDLGKKASEDDILFDMHIHSIYSDDAVIPVTRIVECYTRSGILPLVCDHNTIRGSQEVYREICAFNPDIPVILSEEIMTSEGEIIGLFLEEVIPPFLSAEETLDRIQDQDALALIPHPFCSFRSSVIRADVLERIIDRVDIVEGYNARVITDDDNTLARNYAFRHRKPISVGSDAHTVVELEKNWLTLQSFSTPGELMKALPDAVPWYRHADPSVHTLTRFVKAGRKLGLFRSF